MAKNQYNFTYDNTLPTIIVGEMVVTVNNRKSTMKQLQEAKAKAQSGKTVSNARPSGASKGRTLGF